MFCLGLQGLAATLTVRWAPQRAPSHPTLPFFWFSLLVCFIVGGGVLLFKGLRSSEVGSRATSADPRPSLFFFYYFLLLEG